MEHINVLDFDYKSERNLCLSFGNLGIILGWGGGGGGGGGGQIVKWLLYGICYTFYSKNILISWEMSYEIDHMYSNTILKI